MFSDIGWWFGDSECMHTQNTDWGKPILKTRYEMTSMSNHIGRNEFSMWFAEFRKHKFSVQAPVLFYERTKDGKEMLSCINKIMWAEDASTS